MTPKGIGRLIRLDENISKVKFLKTDTEENFDVSKISSEFFISFCIFKLGFKFMLNIIFNCTLNILFQRGCKIKFIGVRCDEEDGAFYTQA